MERLPRAVAARQRQRRGLADMAHAERIDEAVERNLAPLLDGVEQVAHRGLAVAFDLLQLDLVVALSQREDVGRLLDPVLLEEEFDLLLAQALDVEGAARGEQLEVLDLLDTGRRIRRCSGRARPPRRSRSPRAPRRCAEDTGISSGNDRAWRPSAACRCTTSTTCGMTSPARWMMTVSPMRRSRPLAERLAVAADALDVVLVVQRDVLHDHAADADRLELADRRERAGAADLDLDVLEHGDGALGRELVRDRPARRARDEAEPLLPVEAVDLVDDAVDVVVELGAASARSRGGRRAVPRPNGRSW